MILTEDRSYVISLDMEENDETTGLGGGQVELEFTNRELLHAIITCGMPMQRLTPQFTDKRKSEILYKMFLVEAALEVEGDRLKKSARTMYLDSSEKSVISYYLGMFFTKLISRRLFDVDYLVNLNLVEKSSNEYIDYFCSKWRPDMIGYKIGDDAWSVWEAKGGSNRRAPALAKGCEQAGDIASINHKKPDPAAVCMTYYDHGYLRAIIKKTSSEEGAPVDFDANTFFETYYRPLRELFMEHCLKTDKELKNVEVEIAVPDYGLDGPVKEDRRIRIGMPGAAFKAVLSGNYEALRQWDRKDMLCQDGCFYGEDFLYIR